MRRRPIAFIILCIVCLCAFAAVCAATWRIISPESAKQIEKEYVSSDTTTLFTSETTYNGSEQKPKLSDTGKLVFGEDISNFDITWQDGNYRTTNNSGPIDSTTEHDSKFAGTHRYTIVDNITGQVIASRHVLTIGADEASLSGYTPFVDMPGKTGSITVSLLGSNSQKTFQVTVQTGELVYADGASSSMTHTNAIQNAVTLVGDNANNYVLKESITVNAYAIPTVYISNGTNTYYYKDVDAAFADTQKFVSGYTMYLMQTVSGKTPTVDKETAVSFTKNAATSTVTGHFSHTLTKNATIPEGATLLIPYDSANTTNTVTGCAQYPSVRDETKYPDYFKNCLTIAANVTLTNRGTIQVPGVVSGGNGSWTQNSVTAGNHSRIYLEDGANIESTGNITCHGFIQEQDGNGVDDTSIVMNSGTLTVVFSIVEHRGGTVISSMDESVAPFNQFYTETVSSRMVIHKNASVVGFAVMSVTNKLTQKPTHASTNVSLIGSDSKNFLQFTEDGCWAELTFSEKTGRNTAHLYGSGAVNKIEVSVNVMGIPVDLSTENSFLPLNHYWDLTFDTVSGNGEGTATISSLSQDVKILPGCSVTLSEGVTWNARNVAVYSSAQQIPAAGSFVYPEKDPGVLKVNGHLNATNLGGYVQTESADATVTVSGKAKTSSNELGLDSSSLVSVEINATGPLYHFSGKEDGPLTGSSFVHNSTRDSWYGENSKYKLNYVFIDGGSGEVISGVTGFDSKYYTPLAVALTAPQASNLPEAYKKYAFSGWYWDAARTQSIDEKTVTGADVLSHSATTDSYINEATVYGVLEEPAREVFVEFVSTGLDTIPVEVSGLADGTSAIVSVPSGGTKISLKTQLSDYEETVATNYTNNVFATQYLKGFYLANADGTASSTAVDISAIDVSDETVTSIKICAVWGTKHTVTITGVKGKDGDSSNGSAPSFTVKMSPNSTGTPEISPDSLKNLGVTNTPIEVYIADGQYLLISAGTDDTIKPGMTTWTKITGNTEYTVTGKAGSCIAAGTLITLADGTVKPVEELVETDILRVFDHETGRFVEAPILFIERDGWQEYNVIALTFEDGRILRLIYEHALFDLTLNRYVYITEENYADFIGHEFAMMDGDGFTALTLTEAEVRVEYTGCYSLVTAYHLNYMIDGMLSIPGGIEGLFNFFEYDENLRYDAEKMAADIEKYGLYTYEDFAEYLPEELYYAFQAPYFKVSVGKGYVTFEEILGMIETYLIKNGLM